MGANVNAVENNLADDPAGSPKPTPENVNSVQNDVGTGPDTLVREADGTYHVFPKSVANDGQKAGKWSVLAKDSPKYAELVEATKGNTGLCQKQGKFFRSDAGNNMVEEAV